MEMETDPENRPLTRTRGSGMYEVLLVFAERALGLVYRATGGEHLCVPSEDIRVLQVLILSACWLKGPARSTKAYNRFGL